MVIVHHDLVLSLRFCVERYCISFHWPSLFQTETNLAGCVAVGSNHGDCALVLSLRFHISNNLFSFF